MDLTSAEEAYIIERLAKRHGLPHRQVMISWTRILGEIVEERHRKAEAAA